MTQIGVGEQGSRVWIVTDPMCSWCWGMSDAVERAAARLVGEVTFELMLGGVNVHASQPVGDYGRRLLMSIWRDVQATTGQRFGFRLPDEFVYNSTPSCMAVAAVRRETGRAPFGYLHRLQQLFFLEGANISDLDLLSATAADFGVARSAFLKAVADPAVRESVEAEFAGSRRFGTNALPSVLMETSGERRLLAGGYADADMLEMLVRQQLPTS